VILHVLVILFIYFGFKIFFEVPISRVGVVSSCYRPFSQVCFSCLQDITEKVMAFSQTGPRTVCILSAIGAISSVTLRQPASGSIARYEVLFIFIENVVNICFYFIHCIKLCLCYIVNHLIIYMIV